MQVLQAAPAVMPTRAIPWLQALAVLTSYRITAKALAGPWSKVTAQWLPDSVEIALRPVPYRGAVHCLSIPGELFCVRRGGQVSWTGNSIVALMLQQSDMPFTEDGLTPDLVINTHSSLREAESV